jgi:hypothetical protein
MFFRRAIGGGSIEFWQERVKMEEMQTLIAIHCLGRCDEESVQVNWIGG